MLAFFQGVSATLHGRVILPEPSEEWAGEAQGLGSKAMAPGALGPHPSPCTVSLTCRHNGPGQAMLAFSWMILAPGEAVAAGRAGLGAGAWVGLYKSAPPQGAERTRPQTRASAAPSYPCPPHLLGTWCPEHSSTSAPPWEGRPVQRAPAWAPPPGAALGEGAGPRCSHCPT